MTNWNHAVVIPLRCHFSTFHPLFLQLLLYTTLSKSSTTAAIAVMEWKIYKSFLINGVTNGKTKRNRSAMKSKGKIYGIRTNNQNHKDVIIFLFTKNSKEPKHLQPSTNTTALCHSSRESIVATYSQSEKSCQTHIKEIWKRKKK